MGKIMIKKFGVATVCFPYDIVEESVEEFINHVIEYIGANAVFTPVTYYDEEMSAFWWGGVMPHNKKIKRYILEDGKFYIMPDYKLYKNIKPDRTDDPLFKNIDALRALHNPVLKHGMKLSAWFTLFRNPHLGRKYPECNTIDIFGGRIRHSLCPNHPHVKDYVGAVITDLVKNYKVDSIGLDKFIIETWGGGPLGEGWYADMDRWIEDIDPIMMVIQTPCFCEHCEKSAKGWGFEWSQIVKRVKKLSDNYFAKRPSTLIELARKGYFHGENGIARFILEEKEIYQWLRFKIETLKQVVRDVKKVVEKLNPKVKVGVALDPPVGSNFQRFRHYAWLCGVSYRDLAEVADSIGVNGGWSLEEKYYCGMIGKEAIEDRCGWELPVHVIYPADTEYVRNQIDMYYKLGQRSFPIIGYSWAPLENLKTAKEKLLELEKGD